MKFVHTMNYNVTFKQLMKLVVFNRINQQIIINFHQIILFKLIWRINQIINGNSYILHHIMEQFAHINFKVLIMIILFIKLNCNICKMFRWDSIFILNFGIKLLIIKYLIIYFAIIFLIAWFTKIKLYLKIKI